MANGDPYPQTSCCLTNCPCSSLLPPWHVGTPSYPARETSAALHTINVMPSVAEQMGTDPISKLAAAIEKLADVLERRGL